MAKMKRARQKFHAAAQKSKTKEQSSKQSATDGDAEMQDDANISRLMMPPPCAPAGVPHGDSLFKDVDLSGLHLLKQKLPDFDACSSVTSKTFKGQNLKKKEKLQLRREAWMAKMDSIQSAKQKNKQRKQKQNTPIVGDLTPMEDALPTLELLLKKSAPLDAKKETDEKSRSIPKERKRKKQMLDDISLFHRVHQHPMFQENAAATIKDHLKHKLKQEEQEMCS
ncbi:protein FAM207A [Aplysia californica]|uniref:Protein FAM207A n=1 Tax=Aplysia californica TaxID=6500 RepID=A0ABM0JRN1_APLCA|nr:protein FAM207A [Aplysia californica]